jgi:glycerophosphoryl diester phosphodiesterase
MSAEVLVVAHRGASGYAPENSLAAFELAWELGADAIEGDFRLTADDKIVCIHDITTEKLADKKINVEQSTLAQVLELELKNRHGPKYDSLKVPTLEQVLASVPSGKRIYIELKSDVRIVPPLIEVLRASALNPNQIFIICFDEEVVRRLKSLVPQYKAAWLVNFKKRGLRLEPNVDEVIKKAATIQCDGISVKAHPLLRSDFGTKVKAAGYSFHVWTVDQPDWAEEMLRRGAESITTNYPDRIRQHLTIHTTQ